VGPYDDRPECTCVMEWLDTQHYETETCTMLSFTDDAILIQVGEVPHE